MRFDPKKARERCILATPGPWVSGWWLDELSDGDPIIASAAGEDVVSEMWWDGPRGACKEPDADFIAHARTDLPAALDLLDRCRERLAWAAATIDNLVTLAEDVMDEDEIAEELEPMEGIWALIDELGGEE